MTDATPIRAAALRFEKPIAVCHKPRHTKRTIQHAGLLIKFASLVLRASFEYGIKWTLCSRITARKFYIKPTSNTDGSSA